MNENLPPSLPPEPGSSRDPAQIPPPPPPPSGRANFWKMFGAGIGLVVVSWIACIATGHPTPFGVGFVLAVVSLFFPGRRGIFIGFVSSIGVALLVAAIICGAMLTNMR